MQKNSIIRQINVGLLFIAMTSSCYAVTVANNVNATSVNSTNSISNSRLSSNSVGSFISNTVSLNENAAIDEQYHRNQKENKQDWMNTKNGRVLIFDKSQKIAIIDKKTYGVSEVVKIYDGSPKRGSLIKFNTNEKNIIVDVWIIKP